MVKNEDIARAFRNGTEAKTENMFSENLGHGCSVVYSYGHHFPIAVRLSDGYCLYNTDKYSVSTSRHCSYVRKHCSIAREVNTKFLQMLIRKIDALPKGDIFNSDDLLLLDL